MGGPTTGNRVCRRLDPEVHMNDPIDSGPRRETTEPLPAPKASGAQRDDPAPGATAGQSPFDLAAEGIAKPPPRPEESRRLTQWRQRVDAVRLAWSKVAGRARFPRVGQVRQALCAVQKRYSMTREEASRMASKLFHRDLS